MSSRLDPLLRDCDALLHRSDDLLVRATGRGPKPEKAPTPAPAGPRHESALAPAVTAYLRKQGLVVAREVCLLPTTQRQRAIADLVALRPDSAAVARRMRLEGRRVTIADFWPSLLKALSLAPSEPFRRGDLAAALRAPDGLAMPLPRLSSHLRRLRRYGYLKRCGRAGYVKRSDYIPVAEPDSLVAVELKRSSFRAGLRQALSYARVATAVWVATAGPWRPGSAVAAAFRRAGIGALQVQGDRVTEVLPPVRGRHTIDSLLPQRLVVEERVVREQVLGRPRAFG